MPKTLSEAQVAHFQAEGYLAPFRAISATDAAACRARIEAYEAETGLDAQKAFKIRGHLVFRWLLDLGRNPEILDVVEDLIGPDILLGWGSIFAKSAGDPGCVDWHQDALYVDPAEGLTVGVALTESSMISGCLRVMPRSHLGPLLPHVPSPQTMLGHGRGIPGLDEERAVYLPLAPGEFTVHDERLAHGSLPNRSSDRRLMFAFHYFPTHVRPRPFDGADPNMMENPHFAANRGDVPRATLVRGVDTYGYWAPDAEPRFDLDPVSMKSVSTIDAQILGRVRDTIEKPTTR